MKVKHNFFRDSQCKGKWLHHFEIKEEYETGVIEVCRVCKLRKFFKLVDGFADNKQYMNWHIKSALPKNHPLFYHEYLYSPLTDDLISPYV